MAERETVEQWMARTGQRPQVLGDTHQFQHLTPEDCAGKPRTGLGHALHNQHRSSGSWSPGSA